MATSSAKPRPQPKAKPAKAERRATGRRRRASLDEGDQPFPVNTRVSHKNWGGGLVQEYDGDRVEILFDHVGRKLLSVRTVLELGLLERG
jgi:hypothetical protein